MSEGLDFMADRHRQRLGIFLGADVELAPGSRLRILKIEEINDGRGRVAEVEQPGVVSDAHDFKILKVRHEPEANVPSDGIAVGEKSLREAPANDDEMRVLGNVGQLEGAASDSSVCQKF
jgi:hypothetical protein